MSYDLIYNRRKYNMDLNLAQVTDQDLEPTFTHQLKINKDYENDDIEE